MGLDMYLNKRVVEVMQYKIGDRIEMVQMGDDPHPIEPGTKGTVTSVFVCDRETQLSVTWDNGRSLGVILPVDKVRQLKD